MAKKRKAGAAGTARDVPADDNAARSKLRIKSYEDVAGSDDEFQINRDKVLLDEGPDAKRRRKWQEQEEFLEPSDEEVMDYSEPSDNDDDDSDVDEDGDKFFTPHKPAGDTFYTPKSQIRKSQAPRDETSDADEEEAEEDDEDGAWGSSKQDYYNADAIETEQDALDEEAEALRIQQKQLQAMTAADYGFDESEWQNAKPDTVQGDEEEAVVTEVLPQLQISEDMGPAERLKLLKTRYPEFEPLSKEFLNLKERYDSLTAAAIQAEARQQGATRGTDYMSPVAVTKHRAAAAYLASLTMYFAILTSTAGDEQSPNLVLSAATIRNHPVMDSLVHCRELWTKVRDLPEDIFDDEVASSVSEESEDEYELAKQLLKARDTNASQATSKPKKSKAQKAAEAAQVEIDARRAERIRRTEADLADLDTLTKTTGHATKTKSKDAADAIASNQDDSDFGEETELTAADLAEKAKRKKSLRFYTSQIAQKANKRGAAGRNAGGDDDIPHRERLRDRQARLNAEAANRGKQQGGDDLGGDSDEGDHQQARELRDQEDEYYDMVASKTSKKKSDKKALADAYKEAAAQGGRVVETEEVGADGKRAISYMIEKNKGLTPHRKKDVRNPRVKKRKKFEEKKKKLASMKPVYKGGEGRGGYGGELTGIKKGIVRSTKL